MPVITGRVVEYWTRKPVAGAVIISPTATTVTDSTGHFSLEAPLGTVRIEVSHPDFHPYITNINVSTPTTLDIGTITLQGVLRPL